MVLQLCYNYNLKRYGNEPFYIGHTPTVAAFEANAFFKGEIADIKLWDRNLTNEEVSKLHKEYSTDGLIFHYNFEEIWREFKYN